MLISFFTLCKNDNGNNDSTSKTLLYKGDFNFNVLNNKDTGKLITEIKSFYDSALIASGFNGAILVAKNGKVLFEDYHGYKNFLNNDLITPHTSFHLASISKTLTGMVILRMWEENKLSLDDAVQKYFPAFPYQGISIKMLLSHRSGLPNYLYFMDTLWDKSKKMNNNDVMNVMITKKPAVQWLPDTHYNYCNTNYIILALIIEKISKKSFPEYMKQNLFLPLGMKDSYIFSIKDTANYLPTWSVSRPFPMDQYDCTYGDKNAYCSAQDLFLWDQALYRHTYLRKETEKLAFSPMSNEIKSMHNYGLAWHLLIDKGDTVVYHNGKWHGTNTSFIRLVEDTATIIVLGNKLNNNIYRARAIGTLFNGKKEPEDIDE